MYGSIGDCYSTSGSFTTSESNMENNVKWLILGICLDVLSLILVFLPFFVLELGITPYQRGFFCNDNSIHYPYKSDTVTTLVITLVGILVPIAVIAITELVRHFYASKVSSVPSPYRITSTRSVPHVVLCCYKFIGIFLFGCAVAQSITNISKFTIGRLRPHFLDVCRPDSTKFNCTDINNMYIYVENVACTGTDEHLLHDARLSFPSGHSSMAAYCAAFLVFYLQARFNWKGSQLLRHLAQVACIYGGIFVCLSRVSDYKHHWSDVLGGAFIGTFVAALTSLHIFCIFRMSANPNEKSANEHRISAGCMLTSIGHNDRQSPESF